VVAFLLVRRMRGWWALVLVFGRFFSQFGFISLFCEIMKKNKKNAGLEWVRAAFKPPVACAGQDRRGELATGRREVALPHAVHLNLGIPPPAAQRRPS
jgi:hypothetical protein